MMYLTIFDNTLEWDLHGSGISLKHILKYLDKLVDCSTGCSKVVWSVILAW